MQNDSIHDGGERPLTGASAPDANTTAEDAKTTLHDVAEPIKEEAQRIAAEQKNAGADQMQAFSRAVHGAADELQSEMPEFAGYIHKAGETLARTAEDLRTRNVAELMDGFNRFARERPAMVFGGAMIAGLALSRFLKSSGARAPQGRS